MSQRTNSEPNYSTSVTPVGLPDRNEMDVPGIRDGCVAYMTDRTTWRLEIRLRCRQLGDYPSDVWWPLGSLLRTWIN